jgi:hypothetical protein
MDHTVWWFLHFLQLFRHKNAPNQLFMFWTHKTTQMKTKKISKILRLFWFFLYVFFSKLGSKITFVSIWPLKLQNIGLKKANFLFSVSPALFWANYRKIEAHFIRKFFHVTLQNSYFELRVEIEKNAPQKFYLFWATFCKSLSEFWNLN